METKMFSLFLVFFFVQNYALLPTGEWGGDKFTGEKSFIVDDSSTSAQTLTDAMMYLKKFGYMDIPRQAHKSAPLLSKDGLKDYVQEFQAFAGLPLTGVLDKDTVKLMSAPRCGVKDIVGKGASVRKKRYALQGSRWKVQTLTYKISKYPTSSSLSHSDVDKEIRRALKVWSDVTDLEFDERKTGRVHINIRFEEGEHGDGDPFDGPSGTLAHAYFPVYGGDAHFDNSEHWTIGSYRGTNLLQTAAHEFGHSLGLSHSDKFTALMAPFYRGYQREVRLDQDDVTAVQALYGRHTAKKASPAKESQKPVTRIGTPDIVSEDICSNSTIDSIVTLEDGTTYTFRGARYWKLTDDSIAPGYPKPVAQFWEGLPANIDASFTWTNGKTYFFKGSHYWRFTDGKKDSNYPKLISEGFDGIPDNVDAAFVWSGNGKIYFFKGTQYWRFEPDNRPPVKNSYPRPISNWEGIPNYIDDALKYNNGYTYFFKRGQYYRFDDTSFQVDKADPPYPRPAGHWWFGCTKPSQPLKKNETERNLKEDAQLANNLSRQDTVTNEIIDKGER